MIGLCYSTCAHRYQKATIDMLEVASEVFEEGQRCFMAQTFIRSIDACGASCADVERIFAITESEAKNRFNSLTVERHYALSPIIRFYLNRRIKTGNGGHRLCSDLDMSDTVLF